VTALRIEPVQRASSSIVAAGTVYRGATPVANLLYALGDGPLSGAWQLRQFQRYTPTGGGEHWGSEAHGLPTADFLRALSPPRRRVSDGSVEMPTPARALTVTSLLRLHAIDEEGWQ